MGYPDVFSEEALRRARKLLGISVEEISIVDRAATGLKFSIVKRALPQEISDFLGADAELEKDLEGAQAAVSDAVKKLSPYMEDLPDDLAAAVRKLAAWATAGAYPEAPADTDYGKSKKGGLAKSGGSLWPSFGSAFATVGDTARDDDGLPEHVPERRGVSKAAKGQLDQGDDRRSENLWPSLS
jgi:hypothetical protein